MEVRLVLKWRKIGFERPSCQNLRLEIVRNKKKEHFLPLVLPKGTVGLLHNQARRVPLYFVFFSSHFAKNVSQHNISIKAYAQNLMGFAIDRVMPANLHVLIVQIIIVIIN